MKEFKFTVTDPVGIHARPAGVLVKAVKASGSAVNITKGDKTVDASRLMAVMSLGVKQGEEINISVEEDDRFEEIKAFFEENL